MLVVEFLILRMGCNSLKNRIKCVQLTLFVLLLILSITPIALAGLGVAPAEIELKNALKGQTYERTLVVHNTFGQQKNCRLVAKGESKKWIRFYDPDHPSDSIKNVDVPANKSAKILVKFSIPKDTANGIYESRIVAEMGERRSNDASGQTASLSMPVPVKIRVTGEQILTGKVISMLVRDTEINYPLEMDIEFMNTGNVVAKPDIKVEITQAGLPVDNFTYNKTKVKVDSKKVIPVEWKTEGRGLGDYVAKITVLLDEKEVAVENHPFKILPLGALSRKGFLESLSYKGNLKEGNTIKILAKFTNNGRIDTNAKFIGELYQNDKLKEKIESENTIVPVHESKVLESYVKLPSQGSYKVVGYVSFEGKKSNNRKLEFRLGYPLWMQILLIFVVVLVVALGIWFFIRRQKIYQAKHS